MGSVGVLWILSEQLSEGSFKSFVFSIKLLTSPMNVGSTWIHDNVGHLSVLENLARWACVPDPVFRTWETRNLLPRQRHLRRCSVHPPHKHRKPEGQPG